MPPLEVNWISIDHLQSRFQANISALATRYPQSAQALADLVLSAGYHIHVAGDHVTLGVDREGRIQSLPAVLSAASASATINNMFQDGRYRVSLIAGEDLGWLWNRLYMLPCTIATLPGHRPPMFLMMKDLERLKIILHVQDWRDLLADARVRMFLGPQCVEDFCQSLLTDLRCPWPTLWVTITPEIWPAGFDIDAVFKQSRSQLDARLTALNQQTEIRSAAGPASSLIEAFAMGRPLKVLGITSRYTSFLQHSMRDWLDAFGRLGHSVRLEIESADHELSNSLVVAQNCAEFEPDLIVAIDHYRKSLFGIAPDVPVVMWIQDALPALFCKEAGAAQGPIDFSMSIDPLKMIHEYGYPADRMMSALIGMNESRFTIPAVHSSTPATYACDVCFVSHASTPADVLLKSYLTQHNSEPVVRFLSHLFASLQQIYTGGRMVTNPILIRRLLDQSIVETGVTVRHDQIALIEFIFGNQINNAFFRHQSLQWLADAGVDLHLYGKGWEQHPTLARFARGPADNQTALASIYRSSKINLHISPHGAVHQRVMEGLASGGFFMLRYCAGDTIERYFKTIWDFCLARGVTNDEQLKKQATSDVHDAMGHVFEILQENPFAARFSFVESLQSAAENGYVRSAASIWGEDYDAVAWTSEDDLLSKVRHFLQNPGDREERAQSMRKTVLERFTYVAMNRRLIQFLRSKLAAPQF